jgi:hypothetical protein
MALSTRQGTDALGPHRVALVGHRARANLLLLEGLHHLALVLQQAEIGAELRGRLPDTSQHVQHAAVDLAGIGLPAHGDGHGEPEGLGQPPVQLAHLVMVAAEQLEISRLGAGRALTAAERQVVHQVTQRFGIQQEVLQPERGALADGRELGGLKVRVGDRRYSGVPFGKSPEGAHHCHEAPHQQAEGVTHHHQVGVVCHIRAGGAQV